MKRYIQLLLILLPSLFVLSCKKSGDEPLVASSAVFIHASPGTPAVQIYLDTLLQSIPTTSSYTLNYSSALTGTATFSSGYVGIYPGMHNVSLENRSTTPKKVFGSFNQDFQPNVFYSFFLYDTLSAAGQFKVLKLTDDLSVPAAGMAKVRFLQLAPNAPAMDVTLVRGSSFLDTTSASAGVAVFVPADSITFTNKTYIGATPNESDLSKFVSIPGSSGNSTSVKAKGFANLPDVNKNNRYIIKLKAAGTQTVLSQSAQTVMNAGGIYTIFARGTAQGQPLGISMYSNYFLF